MKERKIVLSMFLVMALVLSLSFAFADAIVPEEDYDAENVDIDALLAEYANSTSNTDDEYADITDEEWEEYYKEYRDYVNELYNDYTRDEPVRAVVVSAGKLEIKYSVEYGYSISKDIVQNIKAKIEEGEHKGSEIEVQYLLSADPLNNIVLAELHEGDKIFVTITINDDGSITGEISNSWSTVQRINTIICVAIIVCLLMVIFYGRKGLITALICAVAIIGAIVIIPIFAFNGLGTIWTTALVALLLIIAISISRLKIGEDRVKAIGISIGISLVSFIIVLALNSITRTVGTVFEYAIISENMILGNMSFIELFYMGTFLITAGVVVNTVVNCINKINRESAHTYETRIAQCKDVVSSSIICVVLVLLVAYIPNHVLLMLNKFSVEEIQNSETLISEIVRILAIVCPVLLVGPIVSLDAFKFGDKYIAQATENPRIEAKASEGSNTEPATNKEEAEESTEKQEAK